MAVQTFTACQILTAADTNTYLANSGLVYVTSATIGTTVSTVNVASAFNSTYDNYRIVVGGGIGSGAITLSLKLGASATGYYAITPYAAYATATTLVGSGDNNAAVWTQVGYAGPSMMQASFDLISPNKATWTTLNNASWAAITVAGTTNGVHQVATAYTDFTLGVNTGTLTGGTITVYGYRKG